MGSVIMSRHTQGHPISHDRPVQKDKSWKLSLSVNCAVKDNKALYSGGVGMTLHENGLKSNFSLGSPICYMSIDHLQVFTDNLFPSMPAKCQIRMYICAFLVNVGISDSSSLLYTKPSTALQ